MSLHSRYYYLTLFYQINSLDAGIVCVVVLLFEEAMVFAMSIVVEVLVRT